MFTRMWLEGIDALASHTNSHTHTHPWSHARDTTRSWHWNRSPSNKKPPQELNRCVIYRWTHEIACKLSETHTRTLCAQKSRCFFCMPMICICCYPKHIKYMLFTHLIFRILVVVNRIHNRTAAFRFECVNKYFENDLCNGCALSHTIVTPEHANVCAYTNTHLCSWNKCTYWWLLLIIFSHA